MSDDYLDALFDSLPTPPPVFAPRGILTAARIAEMFALHAPSVFVPSITTPTTVSIARALNIAAHQNSPLGPLLPRHSLSISQLPAKSKRVALHEMDDDWCMLATR